MANIAPLLTLRIGRSDINTIYTHPTCNDFVGSALEIIQQMVRGDRSRCFIPEELTPFVAPFARPRNERPTQSELDFVFDSDGILLLALEARRNVPGSMRFPPCARARITATTCAPDEAISKGALTLLMIPLNRMKEFERHFRTTLESAARERAIAAQFKPTWCAGLTVGNVISSGWCGGVATERRKNKKKVESDKDNGTDDADRPGRSHTIRRSRRKPKQTIGRRTKRGGAMRLKGFFGGRGETDWRVSESTMTQTTDVSFERAHESNDGNLANGDEAVTGAIRDLVEEFGHEDASLVDAAKAFDGDVNQSCETECRANDDYEDATFSRLAPWTPERLRFDVSAGGMPRPDAASYHDADAEIIATATPNTWVDLRMAVASGSPWTRELAPCGCTLAILAGLVYWSRRALLITQAEGCSPPIPSPSATTALALDLACGTVTRSVAVKQLATDPLFRNNTLMLRIALAASMIDPERKDDRQSCPGTWASLMQTWSLAMTKARYQIASIAAKVRPMSGLAQGWYFARVDFRSHISDATELARSQGLVGRAEEIATTAALTRRPDDSRVLLRRRGLSDQLTTAVALTNTPACDASWAASLAAEKVRLTEPEVGVTIPLEVPTAAIVFPGRRGVCLRQSESTVDVTPDGRDAYVAGTMMQILASGQTIHLDCGLLFPFAFLVLTCGPAARGVQCRAVRKCSVDPRFVATTARAWDDLIWSATAFVADMCEPQAKMGTCLALDPGARLPIVSLGEDDDANLLELYAFRLVGKLLAMACTNGADEELRGGVCCIARPNRLWIIRVGDARALLDRINDSNHATTDLLRRALWTIVGVGRSDDEAVELTFAGADRNERTQLNVELMIVAASSDPVVAQRVLRSLRVAERSTDEPPGCGVGILSDYRLPLSANAFFRDEETADECVDQDKIGDDLETDASAEMRTPCLALLTSELLRLNVRSNGQDSTAGVCRFLMEAEIDQRVARGYLSKADAIKYKKICNACCSPIEIFAACKKAYQANRGVPLVFFPCNATIGSSDELLPMADHPMSNPRCTPAAACHGCQKTYAASHRNDYPSSECYPPKHGMLMSEMIHARGGIVMLPHSRRDKKANDRSLAYSATTVRTINGLRRLSEELRSRAVNAHSFATDARDQNECIRFEMEMAEASNPC
jgi:hypothetical protein